MPAAGDSVESTNTRGRAAGVLRLQSVSTWRRRWSAGSCGAGRASKLGLSWPGPSSMHCPASLICAGRTHTAS